jgi:hypothetical protein
MVCVIDPPVARILSPPPPPGQSPGGPSTASSLPCGDVGSPIHGLCICLVTFVLFEPCLGAKCQLSPVGGFQASRDMNRTSLLRDCLQPVGDSSHECTSAFLWYPMLVSNHLRSSQHGEVETWLCMQIN